MVCSVNEPIITSALLETCLLQLHHLPTNQIQASVYDSNLSQVREPFRLGKKIIIITFIFFPSPSRNCSFLDITSVPLPSKREQRSKALMGKDPFQLVIAGSHFSHPDYRLCSHGAICFRGACTESLCHLEETTSPGGKLYQPGL